MIGAIVPSLVTETRTLVQRAQQSSVVLVVDGKAVSATAGLSVAAALIGAGITTLRHSPAAGSPRGALCLMGVCQECTVLIDGRPLRACMTEVRDGLLISLRGPHAA